MIGTRQHSSYRHEALLYRGEDGLLSGVVPFVRDGIAAGEPVLVALRGPRLRPLKAALGPDQLDVHFVDMVELGHNPARIIPGWQRFLDEHCVDGQPVRGVGEPIWSGRRSPEVAEAQLLEALLNVAVAPDTPLWLRCPYDVKALGDDELSEAARSHPILVEDGEYAGSRWYGGRQHVEDLFGAVLPAPGGPVELLSLPAGSSEVTELVTRSAADAGLDAERSWEVSLAVRESSVAAGPGCTLRVWSESDALYCEIDAPEPVPDPMAGRVRPAASNDDPRGLWLANQICDLVQIRSTPEGSTVRIVAWR